MAIVDITVTATIAYWLVMLDSASQPAKVLQLVAERSGWKVAPAAGRTRGVALIDGYEGNQAVVVGGTTRW
jgi:hypothetical protein